MEVDGVRLHYSDRGEGPPVLLLHGNAVTGDDYNTSGVVERLMANYRVVIFDRPGFGYSERPRWRFWTAADGMRESYTYSLSLDSAGRVWVRHGAVHEMSVLETFGVTRLPEPRER